MPYLIVLMHAQAERKGRAGALRIETALCMHLCGIDVAHGWFDPAETHPHLPSQGIDAETTLPRLRNGMR